MEFEKQFDELFGKYADRAIYSHLGTKAEYDNVKEFIKGILSQSIEEERTKSKLLEEKYNKIIKVCESKSGRENDAGVFARDILALVNQIDEINKGVKE